MNDGHRLEELGVYTQNEDKVAGTIVLPARAHAFGFDVNKMLTKGLTFDEAIPGPVVLRSWCQFR